MLTFKMINDSLMNSVQLTSLITSGKHIPRMSIICVFMSEKQYQVNFTVAK